MRGSINVEEAYAQGKMLDNSEWQVDPHKLPRKITPSDGDMIFDNTTKAHGSAQLFVELSSTCTEWCQLDFGQHMLYRGIVSKGRALCVLAKHSVPKTRKIRTVSDIESFQVMGQDCGIPVYSVVYSGERWSGFVKAWYADSPGVSSTIAMTSTRQDVKGKAVA